jgi:hypothetical protein
MVDRTFHGPSVHALGVFGSAGRVGAVVRSGVVRVSLACREEAALRTNTSAGWPARARCRDEGRGLQSFHMLPTQSASRLPVACVGMWVYLITHPLAQGADDAAKSDANSLTPALARHML